MKSITWTLGLGLLGLTSAGLAADGGQRGERFNALDSDGDGSISFEEFQNAETDRLTRLDSDDSGDLTMDEFLDARPAPGRSPEGDREISEERLEQMRERMEARREQAQAMAAERFTEMDWDGDEVVTQAEFDEAAFLSMDRDGNGVLSPRELRRPRRDGAAFGGPRRSPGRRGDQSGGQSNPD